MDSYDYAQTDREMSSRYGHRTSTRVFEPADYERFAATLYLTSRRGTMTHSLSASIMAQGLATQFAADYEGFDPSAFMRSARTGERYLPDLPDESDERAELEALTDYASVADSNRIEAIEVGGELIFRYTHEPAAPAPEAEPYVVRPVLSSDGVTWYQVKHYPVSRRIECDPRCKGYRYQQDCRHVQEVRDGMARARAIVFG